MMYDDLRIMDIDVEELLEDLLLEWPKHPDFTYNQTAFQKISPKDGNVMCCCPFHADSSPSFGIETSYPYRYNCFACESSGNIVRLVTHSLNLKSELQGLQYLRKIYLAISHRDRQRFDIDKVLHGREGLEKKRTLPESELSKYAGPFHEYIVKRGFRERTLRLYEVGYDKETNSVTFPVRTSSGLLRFINRRSVVGKSFLNEKGVYKRDILYGLWHILRSGRNIKEVYLNESIIDTMSCYENGMAACALMGRLLFKEQVRELLLAGIKHIKLFLDNDLYGVLGAVSAYELLRKTPIKVSVVLYPEVHFGIDTIDKGRILHKDANDLHLSGRMKDIREVPYFSFHSSLLKDVKDFIKHQ